MARGSALSALQMKRVGLVCVVWGGQWLCVCVRVPTQARTDIFYDQDAFIFSGNYKLKNGLIAKFQYGESDDKEETTKQIAVGADFKLNKQVKLFTYYSDISDYRSIDIGGLASYKDNQTIAAGFEVKF